MNYEDFIYGKAAIIDFDSLYQSESEPFPNYRSLNFMTLGPFVLETDGAFETEYFYQRNKTLDCDYLLSSGGEASVVPYIGCRVKNDYLGDEYLTWEQGLIKWNQLRFDKEGDDCDKIIYATDQRNCVYYAAVYVNCTDEKSAIICYENSGSLLYLNGELIDNKPYGRTKGIADFGYQTAVRFRKGLNLLMFKLRVGYICDSFDIGISNFMIIPSVTDVNGLCSVYPLPTAAYVGDFESPCQVMSVFVGSADNDSSVNEYSYEVNGYSEKIQIPALKKGECTLVRVCVPSSNVSETVFVSAELDGAKGGFFVQTTPYRGFKGTEYLHSDFHFDTTYHQEQRTYAMGAMYITKRMVQALDRDPNFKTTLSEVDYLHPFYSIYPEHRTSLKTAFEQARAESDCFYNQPNELTSSGEGFARNMIYGQLYHRDVMGRIAHIYAPCDVFGHCNQLSQICKKGGVSALRWGKTVWGLDSVFHHVSPDLSDLIHDKFLSMEQSMRLDLTHCGASSDMLFGVPAYPQKGDTSWQKQTLTKARMSVFSEPLLGVVEDDKRQLAENGFSKIEQCSRDLTKHHWGVLLTRMDFKQANRACENLLITAEKFSSIAALYGAEYPEKALDKAWRQLICAQHHDSITGTNNEVSFVDLMIEYREAADIAADIVKNACAFIASGVKCTCDNDKVTVFNPHPWKRKEPCFFTLPQGLTAEECILIDENGKEYKAFEKDNMTAFIASVPALGYCVYYIKKANSTVVEKIDSSTIENEYYRLKVDDKLGGGIVSLFDKKAGKEVIDLGVDGPANRIVVLHEIPNRMETQHEIYTTGQKLYSSDYIADVVCEKCSEYQKLTISVKLDVIATVRQEITLWKGIKRVDCKTYVDDYQFRDDLFTVTFPVKVNGGKTVYDDRFAPHIAGKSINKLSFQTHQHVCYSHSRIVPANQWFELGPSVMVNLIKAKKAVGSLNIGMTSIIRKNEKDMILCADKLLRALTMKAVPVTEFSDVEQHGFSKVIHFNEDITDTDTRFVISIGDNEYEKKLLSGLNDSQKSRFLKAAEKDVAVLYTVDNDNVFKKPIDVFVLRADSVEKLNAYIEKIQTVLKTGSVLDIKPTVINADVGFADDYGVAVINNGTVACSVEGENMLNMMLFHTADFYGNMGTVTGGDQLIPEQKSHAFAYSIYPHSGDFRQAEVYRKAFEFNDPLIASQEKSTGNPVLPESKSFFTCKGSFAITSMKLGGYPIAQMKGKIPSVSERGIVVRGFESDSVNCKSKLSFGFGISDVKNSDLLEGNETDVKCGNKSFSFDFSANSIETFRLKAELQPMISCSELGINKERVEPTYIRSWEHNLGSMPVGYLRTAGVIGRNPTISDDGKEYIFEISLANNQPDSDISGTIRISASSGIKSDKEEIRYNVKSSEMFTENVTVTKPEKDSEGIVRIDYTHDGQQFYDIYEFGFYKPQLSLEFCGDTLVAVVKNDGDFTVNGELLLATPFESWDLNGMNQCALAQTSPAFYAVDIPAGETAEYRFDYKSKDNGLVNSRWAAVKLAVNGRVYYGFDLVKGERHNKWTHEYWDKMIKEGNGSLKAFLEMK